MKREGSCGPVAEELEGFGAEERDFLAPRGEGGELLLLRGLEEAVVVEVHELLKMAVRLWRQLELTDGADPGLGRWNGGRHEGKSKMRLWLSMAIEPGRWGEKGGGFKV